MTSGQWSFLVLFNLVLLPAVLFSSRTEKLTEEVWSLKLAAGCNLDYHAPIHAVALACPGVDYIRPLPVTQPSGDPTDTWPGWYAETLPYRGGFFCALAQKF